ncbi:MAG: Zn-ribbon domain-containing OB-fold protein [Methanobacteriota archaeon]
MAAPRFWREIPNRYNLIGTRCGNCNKVLFPPRYICPYCRRMGKLEPYKLSRRGKIVTCCVSYVGPEGMEDQVPYVLAIVELDDGPRLTTQIVDCKPEEVNMGDEVELTFRRIGSDNEDGVIYYGFKFKKA